MGSSSDFHADQWWAESSLSVYAPRTARARQGDYVGWLSQKNLLSRRRNYDESAKKRGTGSYQDEDSTMDNPTEASPSMTIEATNVMPMM